VALGLRKRQDPQSRRMIRPPFRTKDAAETAG